MLIRLIRGILSENPIFCGTNKKKCNQEKEEGNLAASFLYDE